MILEVLLAACCLLSLALSLLGLARLRQWRTLARMDPPAPGAWPRVSVVLTACNEAAGISAALAAWRAADYPDLEIILVDDRSTDGTGDLARQAAGADGRVTVTHIDQLPAGWLGKVHALSVGAARATGEWLLFSDADVRVAPDAVRKAVAYAEGNCLDMLALVPEYETRGVLLTAAWTATLVGLGLMIRPDAVRDPSRSAFAGSGAFNLVRKRAFDRTGGFAWLRMDTADDMTLAMLMKRSGARLDVLDGHGSAAVEIYRSLGQLLRGVEKNGGSTAGHPWRFTLGVTAYMAILLVPLARFASALASWREACGSLDPGSLLSCGPAWLVDLAAAAATLSTVNAVASLRLNSGRCVPALLWPLGVLLFAFATVRATWLARWRGGVRWRGTFYPLKDLSAGRKFEM